MKLVSHRIHESPGNGRLAAPDIAGQERELALLDHVLQPRQCLPVPSAQIEKTRIRRLAERFFNQAVEILVHRYRDSRRMTGCRLPAVDSRRSPWWPR